MDLERKLRKRNIDFDLQDLMYGKRNLDYLIKSFSELKEKYEKEGYKYVSSEIKYVGHDGGVEINLIGYTLETDKELETRLKQEETNRRKEEIRRQKQEERERKQLEKLKDKYD